MSVDKSHPDSRSAWLSRRRFWTLVATGIGLMFLIAAAGIYYGYTVNVPLVISQETTYITEPLTADGKRVDYFAAAELMACPPEMATDENGYRMIVEALGPSEDCTPEERRQVYEKLGLEPAAAPTLTYVQPHDFLMEYAESQLTAGALPADTNLSEYEGELEARLGEPWTVDDLPMMQEWLDEYSTTLDLIVEAAQRAVFLPPWTRVNGSDLLLEVTMPECQRLRSIVRGLAARANHRVAIGDIDGAIDDMITATRMGRHLSNRGTAIESLIGVALEAFAIGPASSLEHSPTEEQLLRLRDELDKLPPRESRTFSLDLDRLGILEVVQVMAHGGSLDTADIRFLEGRSYGLDWNEVTRRVNHHYDELQAGATFSLPDRDVAGWFLTRTERSSIVGDTVAGSGIPALERYLEAYRRSVCKENLLRITIAMLLYEKQHGTLPPAYSVDGQGNPLHSWRVLILPYLGYDELHAQIRLDEPWDSTHNSQFHDAGVPIYQCPSGFHAPGQTVYTVVEGDTTAFHGGEGKRLDTFGPNSANLILVAERVAPVCWMNLTEEVPFAIAQRGINIHYPSTGLGSEHTAGLHAALRSGAVKFFLENIASEDLRGLLEGTIEHAP